MNHHQHSKDYVHQPRTSPPEAMQHHTWARRYRVASDSVNWGGKRSRPVHCYDQPNGDVEGFREYEANLPDDLVLPWSSGCCYPQAALTA